MCFLHLEFCPCNHFISINIIPAHIRPTGGHSCQNEKAGIVVSYYAEPVQTGNLTHSIDCFSDLNRRHDVFFHRKLVINFKYKYAHVFQTFSDACRDMNPKSIVLEASSASSIYPPNYIILSRTTVKVKTFRST